MKLLLIEQSNYSAKSSWQILGDFNVLNVEDKSKSYGNGTNPYCPYIKTTVELDSCVVIENFKGRCQSGKTSVTTYLYGKKRYEKSFSCKAKAADFAVLQYQQIRKRPCVGDAF